MGEPELAALTTCQHVWLYVILVLFQLEEDEPMIVSDLTPEKRAELHKLARDVVNTESTPWYTADELTACGIESEDDAAYIAALTPPIVRALLDAAEERDRLAAAAEHYAAQQQELQVERRDDWTTVTHPTGGVVLRTRDHEAAVAYADRLARQEAQ